MGLPVAAKRRYRNSRVHTRPAWKPKYADETAVAIAWKDHSFAEDTVYHEETISRSSQRHQ